MIIELQEDDEGNQILPLPDDLLKEVGWVEGDTIQWTDNKDGTFTMTKKETELVMVETISMFRMRYIVEVPVGKTEWAGDTVVCNDAKEFSQKHLDEVIVSMRTVTEDEAIDISDVDNDYCSTWSRDQKINAFFTLMGDKDGKASD
jgi:hypothetical protein